MSSPDCPCHGGGVPDPATPTPAPTPARVAPAERTGACRVCVRKHLLKALGYAGELAEDLSRTWERDRLELNLLLAEDHAEELDDDELRAAIRASRLAIEQGADPLRQVRKIYKKITA